RIAGQRAGLWLGGVPLRTRHARCRPAPSAHPLPRHRARRRADRARGGGISRSRRPTRMRSSRRRPLPAAHGRPEPPVLPRRARATPGRSRSTAQRDAAAMKSPLAEKERAALIEAMLPTVPFDGWSRAALRAAARRCGLGADEAQVLFPRGAVDLVAAFSR